MLTSGFFDVSTNFWQGIKIVYLKNRKIVICNYKSFFLPSCFVGLFFCFFLREQMTATPTTEKIISAKRTPPISVKIPAPEINEILKKTSQHVFLWQNTRRK